VERAARRRSRRRILDLSNEAQKRYDERWWAIYNGLPKDKNPKWRFHETTRLSLLAGHGHRPAGNLVAVLRLLAFLAKGDKMDFSWAKNFWKAIRGGAAAYFALALIGFLEQYNEAGELAEAGLPGGLTTLAVVVVAFAISSIRNFISIKFPDANVVKKIGAKIKPAAKPA